MHRGEAGYLRMRREPWQKAGLPYWKGIYSAAFPSGAMQSTPTLRPSSSCGFNDSFTGAAVNSTTTVMAATLRVAGVVIDIASDALALVHDIAYSLQRQWIENAFRSLVTSIEMLGATPGNTTDLDRAGDVFIGVLVTVTPEKAADAAAFCSSSLPRVQDDVRNIGWLRTPSPVE